MLGVTPEAFLKIVSRSPFVWQGDGFYNLIFGSAIITIGHGSLAGLAAQKATLIARI